MAILVIIAGVLWLKSAPSKEKKGNKDGFTIVKGKHTVEIVVKNYGTIMVELDADAAPTTVSNFLDLANEKFYDNLTFHRILPGFVIQGGDPTGTGAGKEGQRTIPGEFPNNDVDNPLLHERGTISMARKVDRQNSRAYMNTATSQFFICLTDQPSLDGNYAAFGKVIEGMEIVDQIAEECAGDGDNGAVSKERQPVIERIREVIPGADLSDDD
jgi:peptidyl-prolyl cis-trans isomerase B (cyclophilin B)